MSNELKTKTPAEYGEIISIIERARENAFRAVNREFISMYRDIGAYVSEKVKNDGWGKAIVKDFSEFIQSRFAGIQGFSASNIWRMRQFYETYKDNEQLAELTLEINWSNNLRIMARAKPISCLSPRMRALHLCVTTMYWNSSMFPANTKNTNSARRF